MSCALTIVVEQITMKQSAWWKC